MHLSWVDQVRSKSLSILSWSGSLQNWQTLAIGRSSLFLLAEACAGMTQFRVHEEQKVLPQIRQWCLRLKRLKGASHSKQAFALLSGTHHCRSPSALDSDLPRLNKLKFMLHVRQSWIPLPVEPRTAVTKIKVIQLRAALDEVQIAKSFEV